MQRPDLLDSRQILRGYAFAALLGGIALVAWRWPMPPSMARLPLTPAGAWSGLLFVCAGALWFSGLTAGALMHVENAAARTRLLRYFALTITLVGLAFGMNGFGLVGFVPSAFYWAPIIIGGTLLTFTMNIGGPIGLPGSTVLRDRPTLRGRFEESIRQAARQEERSRLARDLHDAVKQQLFAIQTAAATVDARFDTDAAGAREALGQVRASAREALTEMEVMLDQLQANPLTMAGLVDALTRACDAMRFRTGAHVTFEAGELPADVTMEPGSHQAMLRFAQEALANVARHARAQHVTVRFGLDQEWTPPGSDRRRLLLSVRDDGQGFDPAAAIRGMGLRNMAARAAEAGGDLELNSAPGHGTTAALSVAIEVQSFRRYVRWAVVGVVILAVLLALNGAPTVKRPLDLLWVSAVIVGTIRAAVAAYRVRSWR